MALKVVWQRIQLLVISHVQAMVLEVPIDTAELFLVGIGLEISVNPKMFASRIHSMLDEESRVNVPCRSQHFNMLW